VSEEDILEGCLQQQRHAQRAMFERYAPTMLGVAKRYVYNAADAEEIMLEALFKAMSNVSQFTRNGSFEGWVRRIVVNEALMFLRKRNLLATAGEVEMLSIANTEVSIEDKLSEKDILYLLNLLPVGYRTVFNLYVIEGYKHREIGDMLGISIHTSKSQLILAKERMQVLIKKYK
jgi:RNA polymerase sigma-70 factor (ECF subfamily)